MNKYELVAAVIALAMFLGFITYGSTAPSRCRIEAIKAGMKGDEIQKACGR